jgi:glycerol-3-phosphate dehydrogenase
MIARARPAHEPWDIVVIGGGATGVGIAVDAASRGYDVLLLEQHDFGKGTSSRSTKLVHGGVRYLEQGNIALVMEALKEARLLRQNAPHLVSNLAFVVPNYDWWEAPFYGLGLKIYNALAGKYGFGTSEILIARRDAGAPADDQDRRAARGVVYYDGQFDDCAAADQPRGDRCRSGRDAGSTTRRSSRITKAADGLRRRRRRRRSGEPAAVDHRARVVINAGGPFSTRCGGWPSRRTDLDRAEPGHSPGLSSTPFCSQRRDHGGRTPPMGA